MIVEKRKNHFIYKVQNWKERFTIEVSGLLMRSKLEGDMMPRFYLPVWRSAYRDSLECWIFPLAPFVLLWRIISQITYIIWKDLVDWLQMLYEWVK